MKSNSNFTENQILLWFVQLARALQHMHTNCLVHRDLKPANVYLSNSNDKMIKLGDFGVSKYLYKIKCILN